MKVILFAILIGMSTTIQAGNCTDTMGDLMFKQATEKYKQSWHSVISIGLGVSSVIIIVATGSISIPVSVGYAMIAVYNETTDFISKRTQAGYQEELGILFQNCQEFTGV